MPATTRTPLGSPTWARQWWIDIDIDSVWVPVRGVTSFQPPAVTESTTTVQPLNGSGWDLPVKTGQAWAGSVTVARKPTRDAAPVYDPGQETLRSAAESTIGTAHLRWYKMDGLNVEAYEGQAVVRWTPSGGGISELDAVSVTLTGQGEWIPIAHPAAT